MSHSPQNQANWLRQALAHDKKPIGILIGAGCPAAISVAGTGPLIPAVEGLTAAIAATVQATSLKNAFETVQGHFLVDQKRAPNIEDTLGFVRSLLHVAGQGDVRGVSADDLGKLDKAICDEVVKIVDRSLPDVAAPYHSLAAWAGAISRSVPLEIFTTNYDLLVEQALEAHRVPYFDGFVGSCTSFFDTHAIDSGELPARWSRLWKMHGSINWFMDGKQHVFRGSDGDRGTCVIHPSHLKYDESRRMPYVALVDRLRAFLRQSHALLVTCGFSFRDQHVNEVVLQALQGNPTASVFVLLRSSLERYPEAMRAAGRRANLSVLAADGAVIGAKRAEWSGSPVDSPTSSPAIVWSDPPTPMPGVAKVAKFVLGDFNRFGEFLQDLTGADAQRDEIVATA